MSKFKFQISNKISNSKIGNWKFGIGNSQSAFTLIEAVVATAVFMFAVTSILGVYTASLQLDNKTRAQRAVARNARFIMEFLAKEVRNGSIDYASYTGQVASSTTDLYLKNQSLEAEHLYLGGANNNILYLTKVAGTTALNSSEVKVTKLKFLANPTHDPLTTTQPPPYNQQPTVTVILELSANSANKLDYTSVINLQSTFTPLLYPSRLP